MEKMSQIINEAYENYKTKTEIMRCHGFHGTLLSQEKFINKCKTDSEFSETWGLRIEERELSLEERYGLIETDKHIQILTWQSHGTDRIKELLDEQSVPTRIITIAYNNETIEIYE